MGPAACDEMSVYGKGKPKVHSSRRLRVKIDPAFIESCERCFDFPCEVILHWLNMAISGSGIAMAFGGMTLFGRVNDEVNLCDSFPKARSGSPDSTSKPDRGSAEPPHGQGDTRYRA